MIFKNKLFFFLITVASLLIITLAGLFWQDMKTLNNAYNDLNEIEFLSSSTQRLISTVQSNQLSQKDIFFIGDITGKALTVGNPDAISVLDQEELIKLADTVSDSWLTIESILTDYSTDSINSLTLARDAHYKAMTDLSKGINEYTTELNHKITLYQSLVLGLAFFIGILMLNNILNTHAELKISKALASAAQIDLATGLFNRSRCQELFKIKNNINAQRRSAILVFDLNDLKKTNDTLGHRAGDELISAFASILRGACKVHVVAPFAGRYGGDEFIVYYEDLGADSEIDVYLKELDYLADQYNSKQEEFKISYAVGWAICEKDDFETTTRKLFDDADDAMYVNKVASKKAKDPTFAGTVSRDNGA